MIEKKVFFCGDYLAGDSLYCPNKKSKKLDIIVGAAERFLGPAGINSRSIAGNAELRCSRFPGPWAFVEIWFGMDCDWRSGMLFFKCIFFLSITSSPQQFTTRTVGGRMDIKIVWTPLYSTWRKKISHLQLCVWSSRCNFIKWPTGVDAALPRQ